MALISVIGDIRYSKHFIKARPITSDSPLVKGMMIIFTGLAGNIYSWKRMANPGISQWRL